MQGAGGQSRADAAPAPVAVPFVGTAASPGVIKRLTKIK